MSIGPDSRYTKALLTTAPSHSYDRNGDIVRPSGDPTQEPIINNNSVNFLMPGAPGTPPPITSIAKETDTVDLLAYQQFQNAQKWWIVADANPHVRHPLDFVMGTQYNLPN